VADEAVLNKIHKKISFNGEKADPKPNRHQSVADPDSHPDPAPDPDPSIIKPK
jgi:hypothetical protein